jgi:hypothetical protein
MHRRKFILAFGGTLVAWPRAGRAQQAPKVARIGYLITGSLESPEARKTLDMLI